MWQCPSCQRVIRKATLGHPLVLMDLPVAGRRRPERKPNAKGRAYKRWLETREWREQAKRVIRKFRYRCQLRYAGVCTYRATQAHHLTYDRFGGDERDSDLTAACRECNVLERERRITRRVMGN